MDFQGVDPHGRKTDRNSFIQAYTSPDLTIDHLHLTDVSVRVYENVGIILGHSAFEGKYLDQPIGGQARFMDVWLFRDKRWQLIGAQVTPIETIDH